MEILVEYWDGRCWKLLDLLDEGDDCMSHFFTVVILPKDVSGSIPDVVKTEVAKLLAPFNEELEVPKWWEKCWCVGEGAKTEVRKQVDKEFGTIDSIRKKFHEDNTYIYDKQEKLERECLEDKKNKEKAKELVELEDKLEKMWEDGLKPREEKERELMLAHPKVNTPRVDCKQCFGIGEYETTSNYFAKWDWWRIGGRWDGEITGEQIKDEEDKGFNFGIKHESAERNITTTDFLLEKQIIPFAIVTPDGKWHEKGEMGWWGIVKDKKEQKSWDEEALEIYKSLEGHIAVGCDLHI